LFVVGRSKYTLKLSNDSKLKKLSHRVVIVKNEEIENSGITSRREDIRLEDSFDNSIYKQSKSHKEICVDSNNSNNDLTT